MDFSNFTYIFFAVLIIVSLKSSIKMVPQSENWLVERLGKYNRKLEAGLHLVIPFFDSVNPNHKVPILERQIDTESLHAITKDNVSIEINLAILYRVIDASKYVYRIYDINSAIHTIVSGTVRNVIGITDLDGVQSNRRHVSEEIESELNAVSEEWGIKLTRVEIVNVNVDDATQKAMQLQLNSERERRSTVTAAEGQKQAVQLSADAQLYAAEREGQAKRVLADAEAYAVAVVSKAISSGGASAVEFEIKKIQAAAIQEISKGNNSKIIMLPSDVLSSLSGTLSRIIDKV
jgi:regulator of protease activity HflC (stomatin/prohibitin superfamily)